MPKHEPDPMQSVASLLEQLLEVAKEQLGELHDINSSTEQSMTIAQQQLQVAQETLQNAQATNSTLNDLLASSKRIEQLLGGGETAPAALRIKYDKILELLGGKK